MVRFEIVSQGEELVSGSTVDTNAGWLCHRLKERGFTAGRVTVVGDERDGIRDVLAEAAARAPVVICTGGLGPTSDDLTTEAAGLAFGRGLAERADALEQVEARYRARNRVMPPANRKQAVLPDGATLLENLWGTAPGYRLDVSTPAGATRLYFLPGVPSEMKRMFDAHVLPDLDAHYALPPKRTLLFRCVGLPESEAAQRMDGLERPGVLVGYRAHLPEIHVKLHLDPGEDEAPLIAETLRRLGPAVFTVGGGPLAEVVGRRLHARGETLATAESCTAGRIAADITTVPGASAWFLGGAVVYANAEKVRQCGVPEEMLQAHGAVSEPVARALAEGIRARTGATWGLAVTGVAGPGGGTPEKPVGTVHVAVSGPDGTVHSRLQLPFDRTRNLQMTTAMALDLLRRQIQDGPDGWSGAATEGGASA